MNLSGWKEKFPLSLEFPLLFAVLYLPSYLNQPAGLPAGYFDHLSVHIQTILTALPAALLILYLTARESSETSRDPLSPPDFPSALLTLAGLGGLYLLMSLTVWLVSLIPGADILPRRTVLLTRPVMLLPAALTCLAAAFLEELFFRFYGFSRLMQSGIPPRRSILIMSLLFSAGHLYEGAPGALFAFVSGLFLGELFRRGRSLLSLTAAHGVFNFLMITLSYILNSILKNG